MNTALLSLCLFSVGQKPAEDAAFLDLIHERARSYAQAFQEENHAKLVELMHPKWAEQIGPRSRLVQAWKKKIAAHRYQGLWLDKYDVQRPTTIVKAGPDWLCIVPARLHFQAVEGQASQQSFLLALSHDQGKRWQEGNAAWAGEQCEPRDGPGRKPPPAFGEDEGGEDEQEVDRLAVDRL